MRGVKTETKPKRKKTAVVDKPQEPKEFRVSTDALDKALSRANVDGWYCRQILPHSTSNLFMLILSAVCLCFTLGLWTFGAGYLLLLEKDSE